MWRWNSYALNKARFRLLAQVAQVAQKAWALAFEEGLLLQDGLLRSFERRRELLLA